MPTFDNDNTNHPSLFAVESSVRLLDTWQIDAEARRLQSHEMARLARLAAARGLEFVHSYVFAPAVRWYLRRKLYQTLSRLDDRMLNDIGLSPHEIPMAVHKAYPGKAAARTAPKDAVHFIDAGSNRVKVAAAVEDTSPLAA